MSSSSLHIRTVRPPGHARASSYGSVSCAKRTSRSSTRCSRPTACTRSSTAPGLVGPKALEMARAYARFVPKVRDLAPYDAVLVNREATLIGPAADRALGGPERQAADLSARRSPLHPLPQSVERMALVPQGAGEGENAVRDQQGRAGELAESRGFRAQAQRKCLGDPERRRCRPLHGLDAGHRPRSTAPCAWDGAGARARPRTCK